MKFTAACIQLNSQDDIEANARAIEVLVREAAGKGASLICLPENCFQMLPPNTPYAVNETGLNLCRALARELKIWILIGSLSAPREDGLCHNRSLLINDAGEEVALYDKIHLFDVALPGGEHYRESDRMMPGGRAVLASTPWGKMGLTICYDVRFPQLYRSLAKAGADFLFLPAAFTHTTGKAHWHVLLRARAIENGAYVLAPAQCGTHPGGRRTYGHAMIISPWGEILAEASEDEPGIIYAEIDPARVEQARKMIPSLQHDRDFSHPAS